MEIRALLSATKQALDLELKNQIDSYQNTLPRVGKTTSDAFERLSEFSVRGKGIRGSFVLLVAELLGGNRQVALPVGAALELVHSTLLIQDDIMDQDTVRRGKPTIWSQYEKEGKKQGMANPRLYGYSQAISLADFSYFLALRILSDSLKGVKSQARLMSKFSETVMMVGFGQMDDVYFGSHPTVEPSATETEFIYEFKTARYTFSLPFALGAIVAQQELTTVSSLESLGKEIGMLFQIRDDELSLIGTEAEIGKPSGGDIRENKKTPIRALFMHFAPKNICQHFGNEQINSAQIEEVRKEYYRSGISERVESLKNSHYNKCQKLIEQLNISQKGKALFLALSRFVMERSK
jgi:geranylgeranyl pyrophosphate synthase